MKLNSKGITDKKKWLDKGYKLPEYDRDAVRANTVKNPKWIHFGAGNIFRAFQANVMQDLLNRGITDTGLIVAEGYDYEIIEKMNRPHDDLSILVTLKADGTVEKTVVGSVVESCMLDEDNEKEIERLRKIFRAPSLQMVSFTITEKGYKTPAYMSKVTRLLYERFLAGALPVAMVSMDNCSHNGDKLYEAVIEFADKWEKDGTCKKGFKDYVSDKSRVSFPLSMIDKITPRPDAKIESMLIEDGIDDLLQVVTSKNTYVAPFVNAEETQYLVIEDVFPNGREAYEKGGIIFTDRETVDKTEKMKVCTCLNPLHTALAVFGCLLGYTTIHDEMDDKDLKDLVYKLGYVEGMPVVVDPKVLSPKDFIEAVLKLRLPNPFMPDTPQRIACDTSQKIPIRFGETIKAYRERTDLSTDSLTLIPLVLAGWLRYLKGIDDNGDRFELSPDPKLDELKTMDVKDILKKKEIFAVDLYEDKLADKILAMYEEMMQGNGSVRKVLKKYVDSVLA